MLARRANGQNSVWVLAGEKSGDNAQMMTLAGALTQQSGWACVIKTLAFRTTELLLHGLMQPSLAGLTRRTRGQIAPPWPSLVVSSGRRTELVARWVKARSPATRLVHLGRPWSHPAAFDLVVTTPQHFVPQSANVLTNLFPLHRLDQARLSAARDVWAPRLAGLGKPRVVVLLGGNSGACVYTQALAQRFATEAQALLEEHGGGTLLVASSRRTPPGFVTAFTGHLTCANLVYDWRDLEPADPHANPYFGFLAWGDMFVVSPESVSMTVEALLTGKPTHLLSWPHEHNSAKWLNPRQYGWKPLSHRLAMRVAPRRLRRDVLRFQDQLARQGYLRWLAPGGQSAEPEVGNGVAQIVEQDLARTVARVEQLFQYNE